MVVTILAHTCMTAHLLLRYSPKEIMYSYIKYTTFNLYRNSHNSYMYKLRNTLRAILQDLQATN